MPSLLRLSKLTIGGWIVDDVMPEIATSLEVACGWRCRASISRSRNNLKSFCEAQTLAMNGSTSDLLHLLCRIWLRDPVTQGKDHCDGARGHLNAGRCWVRSLATDLDLDAEILSIALLWSPRSNDSNHWH